MGFLSFLTGNKDSGAAKDRNDSKGSTSLKGQRTFYDFSAESIDGAPVDLSIYKGKVLLVGVPTDTLKVTRTSSCTSTFRVSTHTVMGSCCAKPLQAVRPS